MPSLHEALAFAAERNVEASAPAKDVESLAAGKRSIEQPRELPLEMREGTVPAHCPSQFIHNVPRRMRVGRLETVEVRIPRRMADHAITVQLRAPDGGFLIYPLSPETRGTHEAKGAGHGSVSWKWKVMPQCRGELGLLLIVSAQTLDRNGVTVEAAFPDQVIKIYVRANYARVVRKMAGWTLLIV